MQTRTELFEVVERDVVLIDTFRVVATKQFIEVLATDVRRKGYVCEQHYLLRARRSSDDLAFTVRIITACAKRA